jgi:uncharacterized membrane protein YjjP (DUF1212 family)
VDTAENKEHIVNSTDRLLCLALDVGEGILRNGGEINRVEDTIERICKAYGAAHVEVFTIISVIHAAIRMPDGSYSSQMRRVRVTSNNLAKLEDFNALSRHICKEKPSFEDFDEKIREVKSHRGYPKSVQIAASGVATGGFALFFGGSIKDALVATVLGVLIALIDMYSSKRLNNMAKTVISSFAATVLAALCVKLGIGDSVDFIMIGTIMILVPGVAFGIAMRDLLCGDLLAGTLKTLQACMLALMIAFGYMMGMLVVGGVIV